MIELKKHTEKSRLPFCAQQVENYAGPGGSDQRKYHHLSLLAEQVWVSGPLPLYTLYYSMQRTSNDLWPEWVTRDGAGGFRGRPVATIGQSYRLPTQGSRGRLHRYSTGCPRAPVGRRCPGSLPDYVLGAAVICKRSTPRHDHER